MLIWNLVELLKYRLVLLFEIVMVNAGNSPLGCIQSVYLHFNDVFIRLMLNYTVDIVIYDVVHIKHGFVLTNMDGVCELIKMIAIDDC